MIVFKDSDLLPEIACYFEQEAHNTANRPSERAKLQEIHDALVDPELQLYLYFLQGRLPVLASINTQLQKSSQDLFTSYQKIASFKNAFLELILERVDDGMQDGNICTDVDNIDYECSQFQHFKEQAVSSGQLSSAQLHQVMKNVFYFTVAIGRSLETRFPEMNFVAHKLSFPCPTNRKHSRCDIEAVIKKYCKDSVNVTTAKMQYSVYRNDESLTHLFINCEIAQMPEYDQFGLLAMILMCMSPDTVECECGFSSTNLTKDKFPTRLSQNNPQARLLVNMDNRTLDSFPWHSLNLRV